MLKFVHWINTGTLTDEKAERLATDPKAATVAAPWSPCPCLAARRRPRASRSPVNSLFCLNRGARRCFIGVPAARRGFAPGTLHLMAYIPAPTPQIDSPRLRRRGSPASAPAAPAPLETSVSGRWGQVPFATASRLGRTLIPSSSGAPSGPLPVGNCPASDIRPLPPPRALRGTSRGTPRTPSLPLPPQVPSWCAREGSAATPATCSRGGTGRRVTSTLAPTSSSTSSGTMSTSRCALAPHFRPSPPASPCPSHTFPPLDEHGP